MRVRVREGLRLNGRVNGEIGEIRVSASIASRGMNVLAKAKQKPELLSCCLWCRGNQGRWMGYYYDIFFFRARTLHSVIGPQNPSAALRLCSWVSKLRLPTMILLPACEEEGERRDVGGAELTHVARARAKERKRLLCCFSARDE